MIIEYWVPRTCRRRLHGVCIMFDGHVRVYLLLPILCYNNIAPTAWYVAETSPPSFFRSSLRTYRLWDTLGHVRILCPLLLPLQQNKVANCSTAPWYVVYLVWSVRLSANLRSRVCNRGVLNELVTRPTIYHISS